MNSFPAKFTSLIIAFLASCTALYLSGGWSLPFLMSVLPDLLVMSVIYILGAALSPFITLAIYKGGKWISFAFGLMFVILTSGAFYILMPFFEVVLNSAIACIACAFFAVVAYASYRGVKLLRHPAYLDAATRLLMQGFAASQINKKVFYKGALFGFVGQAHKIIGYIALVYLPAQVIGGYNGLGIKILMDGEAALGILASVCAFAMLLGIIGVLAERIFLGKIVCKEELR